MNEVINAMLHLLHDTEEVLRTTPGAQQKTVLADFLRDFRLKRLNPLHWRLEHLESRRFVVSMVGLTNVGKSTLAHALLRHPVAPRRNGPATAIPVEYEHGPAWTVKTHSLESQAVHTQRFDTAEEVSASLKRLVFDQPEDQAVRTARVIVRGPMDLLEGGLVFADTPGYGAAQAHEAKGAHQARLTSYLQSHVHEVFFCVSGAQCMVGKEEVEFFRAIRELCSTVVVTKWDSEPEQREAEMRAYRSRFSHLFPMCGFLFVEAKWAIAAYEKNDEGRLDASQIEDLRAIISQRALPQDRMSLLGQQVVAAWNDFQELACTPIRTVKIDAIPWRKDGIARLKRAAKIAGLELQNNL
jgi:GTP-binding protein EngB required for normal cell division